jgi:hypothetical protein
MLYIFARGRTQARAAAQWLELHPGHWRAVTDGRELEGVDSPKLLLFGMYYANPRYTMIIDIVRAQRGFISCLEDRRRPGLLTGL